VLVELSVMEQRYQAVLAVVQDGCRYRTGSAPLGPGMAPVGAGQMLGRATIALPERARLPDQAVWPRKP
jgi:hypothetical protein